MSLSRIPSLSHDTSLVSRLTPRPDRNSTFRLDLNRPLILRMHDPATIMVVTLRSTSDGVAMAQFGYYPDDPTS